MVAFSFKRMLARTAATATDVPSEYTAAVKAETVRKFRTELFKSQEVYLFASLAASDGVAIAAKIVSSGSQDDLMSESARKKLEALRSRKVPQQQQFINPTGWNLLCVGSLEGRQAKTLNGS